tara:strand:- start:1037 stop:1453 length:417 start_codon:yes stop_codon:yes gene_type:complete
MIATIEPIVETLEALETDLDRYEYLMELGDSLLSVSEEQIIKEENFVPGCQSSVWVTHEYTDNTLQYFAHSDSKLVKGLLHILTEAFSGYHPNDMLQFNTASIQKIPLGAQLSMQRQIGMMSVFKRFQQIAKQYTASA